MTENGKLPATALTTVQGTIQLSTPTATAYRALAAAAKTRLGRTISIATPEGGYRSYSVQAAMHDAGAHGPASARIKWGLNPNSTVAIAAAGYSSHGLGTRVDVVGSPMDSAFLNLAKTYGFTREFGASDPNHFEHDGKTAITAPKPAAAKKYVTVVKGNTLSGIAAAHKITLARIEALNPQVKAPSYVIRVGDKIRVA